MADAFYPFVGEGPADENTTVNNASNEANQGQALGEVVRYPTRIAIFDDPAAAPRVIVIQPKDVRSYLEEITATVTRLAKEQGGRISFTVIREVVENLVHAYFIEPTISILDGGNTIRFSDQGPGIREKDRALEYGTTSATEEMKKYIRGVGSGLPYAQQYMQDHGGSLTIEDNLNSGTIVTISMPGESAAGETNMPQTQTQMPGTTQSYQQVPPQQTWTQPMAGQYQQTPANAWQQPMQMQPAMQPGMQPMPYMQQAPGYGWQQMPYGMAAQQQPQPQTNFALNERGMNVLAYLSQHESVGPTDLMNTFGGSVPTWTRALQDLEDQGILKKRGQKRYLTDAGRALL